MVHKLMLLHLAWLRNPKLCENVKSFWFWMGIVSFLVVMILPIAFIILNQRYFVLSKNDTIMYVPKN